MTSAIMDRWEVLLPPGTAVVDVRWGVDETTLHDLDALKRNNRVAIVGGRRGRRLARRHHIRVETVYVALPSVLRPVAIVEVAREPLRWFANAVLTVPPGDTRLHGLKWAAVLLLRRLPGLLTPLPLGERIVIGVRK